MTAIEDRFDLAAVIGTEALAALAEIAGGLELYVPCRLPLRGPLGVLPEAAQQALVHRAAGSMIYVPLPVGQGRAARDAALRAEAAAGVSRRELARRYGLSVRQVRRIVRSARS